MKIEGVVKLPQWWSWSSFFIGFLSSLFAALIIGFLTDQIRGYRLQRRFSKLKGRYIQCDLEGNAYEGRFTNITKVKRNLLTVEGDDATNDRWHAKILLDEKLPGFGRGQYQYSRHDCGRLEIQVAGDGETILVQAQNTSHGQDAPHTLLWKITK